MSKNKKKNRAILIASLVFILGGSALAASASEISTENFKARAFGGEKVMERVNINGEGLNFFERNAERKDPANCLNFMNLSEDEKAEKLELMEAKRLERDAFRAEKQGNRGARMMRNVK